LFLFAEVFRAAVVPCSKLARNLKLFPWRLCNRSDTIYLYLVPVCKKDESHTSTKNEDLFWAVLPMVYILLINLSNLSYTLCVK
jgi:hypothetical protein